MEDFMVKGCSVSVPKTNELILEARGTALGLCFLILSCDYKIVKTASTVVA